MSTRTPLARRIIAALLLVLLTACHSWQPVTISPQTQPSSVRITTRSGEIMIVGGAVVTNDSIIGATDTGVARVAWQNVRAIEVRAPDTRRSVALGLLAGVVMFGIVAVDALSRLDDT